MITIRYVDLFVSEGKLQRYIMENREKFGFTQLRYGKKGEGIDFVGTYKGQEVKVEVEIAYAGYSSHFGDPRFKDVKILICLEGAYPTEQEKPSYPPIILYVKTDEFRKWLKQKGERGYIVVSQN